MLVIGSVDAFSVTDDALPTASPDLLLVTLSEGVVVE